MLNRENYTRAIAFMNYLRSGKKRKENSIERYQFYLRHFLLWADEQPIVQAPSIHPTFPEYVSGLPSPRGNSSLANETQKKILSLAKRFLIWLKNEFSGEFRSIKPTYLESLQSGRFTPNSDDHEYVTLEEAIQLATYPIDRSNLALWATQASVAFLFLSGQRAGAYVTTPIKALHLDSASVEQKPELGVHTKNGRSAVTFLLPIPELLAVVQEWDAYVRSHLSPDAVWYAPVANRWGEMKLSGEPVTINRRHTLIKRLHQLSKLANMPYRHPHLFRHGHAVYGLQHCRTMSEFQAVSRNLMHSNMQITDEIYGGLERNERARVIASMFSRPVGDFDDELSAYLNQIDPGDIKRSIQILAGRI
jgi:integrase